VDFQIVQLLGETGEKGQKKIKSKEKGAGIKFESGEKVQRKSPFYSVVTRNGV